MAASQKQRLTAARRKLAACRKALADAEDAVAIALVEEANARS